jgi:hypothetical protein
MVGVIYWLVDLITAFLYLFSSRMFSQLFLILTILLDEYRSDCRSAGSHPAHPSTWVD